ncbi:hypothetical protein [Aquimarina sp. I32.4]|uniref:hypothetical protein n=1 Tax=Aquimarina sp. I32.4 TaxID=2053903 RepID=UPI000CDE63AA|nr:hypothetical protein [Aquimarina sp. I32.4]
MKTIFYRTICSLFLLTLFISCSSNGNRPTFTTSAGIETLKDKLSDTFDKDKQISQIIFFSKNSTMDAIEQISIFFPENNKNTMWFYNYATGQLHKPEAKEILKSVPKTNAISAFNINECHVYFKEAIALIENETDEFSNYRVESYHMSTDQTSGKIMHSFTLNTDKKTMKRTFYGEKVNDHLYRFEFETNEDGKLIATHGLDAFEE